MLLVGAASLHALKMDLQGDALTTVGGHVDENQLYPNLGCSLDAFFN